MSMISELVKELRNEAQEVRLCSNECESAELLDRAADTIEMLSEKAREPKHGEWIYGEHDVAMCDGYRCDKCGFFVPWDYEHKFIDFINDYHFCPNCGARMKGAADE